MTPSQPTVSVIIASYNGEQFLREQLDSILNQSYPISELIIQDDCSTDSTATICREYEAKFAIVHFYENEHNLGYNKNFETATMRATGDYVALSDQDDVWSKDKIAKQVAAIGHHDMCTCELCRGETPDRALDVPYNNDIRPGTHLFRCLLGHSMLIRRAFAQDASHWQGALYYDWSLTLHADWNNGIARVNEVLVFHRSHPGSVTSNMQLRGKPLSKTAPIMHGPSYFRKMQQMPKYVPFYQYIKENTQACKDENMKLQHRLSTLMLSKSALGYLRLSLLCMVKRKEIYFPAKKAEGVHGLIRGFFYPGIFAYYCYPNFE